LKTSQIFVRGLNNYLKDTCLVTIAIAQLNEEERLLVDEEEDEELSSAENGQEQGNMGNMG
jgi:hypothetical protein